MLTKGLIYSALYSLVCGVSLKQNDNVMSLTGALNLPVSLSVGQASLSQKHDETNCPYLALLDQAAADEAYAQSMEDAQAKAIADEQKAAND